MSNAPAWFVKRDLDGFFGLFVDNLVQLLAILALCGSVCGMSGENASYLFARILPGVAVSVLAGNIFYAWQARRLAIRSGREDVTALPYGINTPSLIVYVFFVLKPVLDRTGSVEAAWRAGLIACLGSGVIELAGAPVAGWIRKHTPRAALLSTLAGISIGFIAMTFALEIYQSPLVGLVPLVLLFVALLSHVSFPLGIPGGMMALAAGVALAWLATGIVTGYVQWFDGEASQLPLWLTAGRMEPALISQTAAQAGWYPPIFVGESIWETLRTPGEWVPFLTVIIPMGLFNVIGSLQNIESAEAVGDSFPTGSSLAVNGIGTIAAACFGSCFPTTIYIGHPGWKSLGARWGYSILNGFVITAICLFGLVALIASIVPLQAGAAIVLWIGIIITAQAFRAVPANHSPAVAVGLFPAIAAWGATVMVGAFNTAGGQSLADLLSSNHGASVNGFLIHSLILLERGYIFTCMILSAVCVCLIERRFFTGAGWLLIAAALTALGVMHAYQVPFGNVVDYRFRFAPAEDSVALTWRADGVALGYLLGAVALLLTGAWYRKHPEAETSPHVHL